MPKKYDLAGKVIGSLTITKQVGRNKHKKLLWACRCTCGREIILPSREAMNRKECRCPNFVEVGKCKICGNNKQFYKDPNNRNGHKPVCVDCYNAKRKERYYNLKREVMEHYGGCHCAICGEKDITKLSIDHINGGGYRQAKYDKIVGSSLYSWLRRNLYPEGYQVLCMTCNMGKGKKSTEEFKDWILKTADYLRNK